MPYNQKENALESSQVVNWLLSKFNPEDFLLTNLKLNKTIYFLHGYCLAKFEIPLVRNHFEVWDYGPVVGSLYHNLKKYGSNPVSKKMSYLDYGTGKFSEVDSSEVSFRFGSKLDRISEYLVSMDVWALVFQTHAEGGAWDEIQKAQLTAKRSTRIPDRLIAEHYRNLIGGKLVH